MSEAAPVPEDPPIAPPPKTSAAATVSLLLAVVGSLCFGPIGGIAAVIVGLVALWNIHSHPGQVVGKPFAWLGLAIGSLTTVGYTILISTLLSSISLHKSPFPRISPSPPTSTASPPAVATSPRATMRGDTTEIVIETTSIADIGSDEASLAHALREQIAKLSPKDTLLLHTVSSGCRPCLAVAASFRDPLMTKALAHVRIVRVDVDEFRNELDHLGIPSQILPGFYRLGKDLSATDGVTGAEWDDDTAENIAPVLGAFVRGTYTRRRVPWASQPKPSPKATNL